MAASLTSEWLETNGTGGFSCGTVSGEIRRKWHGLFWIARNPPRERVRLLVGMEEYLRHPKVTMSLTSTWADNQWNPPEGWPMFVTFPFPQWRWELEGGAILHKYIMMPKGSSDTLWVCYGLRRSAVQSSLRLSIRPIISCPSDDIELSTDRYQLASFGGFPLVMSSSTPLEFLRRGDELGPVTLETEKDCEDIHEQTLYTAAELGFEVTAEKPVFLRFGISREIEATEANMIHDQELARRTGLRVDRLPDDYEYLSARLSRAGEQFVVSTSLGRPTVIAGYPWFTDWGRDTMISLPGLCLQANRLGEARDIIRHFLTHLNAGLIPNIFPEGNHPPQYNTVDATLWLVEMAFRCWDVQTIINDKELWSALKAILAGYQDGTHHNIRLGRAGLVIAGNKGAQLTWMDVRIDDEVPTPRHGKPVEIQGLWYNALMLIAGAAREAGEIDHALDWEKQAGRAKRALEKRFPLGDGRGLADVVDRDGKGTRDETTRPNQIIPFALRHNIIPKDLRPEVLRHVYQRLLTPKGLRTLDPEHPDYKPVYKGNLHTRDHAYHQGTVWPWLLAPYVKGIVEEREQVPELAEKVPEIVQHLVWHFENEGCLDSVNEIFDGNTPHRPRGCFAQAWSVSALVETLQALRFLQRNGEPEPEPDWLDEES
ncbi:MAG: glycogen debranching enzyme N-terminal domain-containing protein [Candidatus Sumerlaeia bacterium]|nr:glycogen debranching enzyme N-terminal domain-containing protein [Candidatus Sumerlaeia bacterium]